MAKPTWIDYKQLKDALDFAAVLTLYNVNMKGDTQLHGFCPLPTHVHKSGAKANSPSFSANAEKKAFQCFGCGATGNVIDLACRLDNLDPENADDFRQTATKLAKHFGIKTEKHAPAELPGSKGTHRLPKATPKPETPAKLALLEVVNAPLGFELKELEFTHPYLFNRGFDVDTTAHFGLGFCKKGLMKDRFAIPIHNLDGELVAYAGRVVDDTKINADCPRYLFPSDREKDGVNYRFRKSELLYNGHRALALGRKGIIIVEGYTAVWWLHQAGFPNVVAVMGASMSDAQATLILTRFAPSFAVVLADGDAAGARMAESALVHLAPALWIRWERLTENQQPTDLSATELQEKLGRHFGK